MSKGVKRREIGGGEREMRRWAWNRGRKRRIEWREEETGKRGTKGNK